MTSLSPNKSSDDDAVDFNAYHKCKPKKLRSNSSFNESQERKQQKDKRKKETSISSDNDS